MMHDLRFQQELKRLRNSKRITQEQLASKLNLQRSTYAQKEKNGKFTDDELEILCNLFGVSFDYLKGISRYDDHKIDHNFLKKISDEINANRIIQKVLLNLIIHIYANQTKRSPNAITKEINGKVQAELLSNNLEISL